VAASRHIAWRTSIAGPTPPGHPPAWAPELSPEEEAIAWLGTERPNLHACTAYAATHGHLVHAVWIPVAISDFLHVQAWALNYLGVAQTVTGDYPSAATSVTQALELFRDFGDRHGEAAASINLGELLCLSSPHREARSYYDRALSIARDINAPLEQARALEGIGRCHSQEGNLGQDAAHLRQAASSVFAGDEPGRWTHWSRPAGRGQAAVAELAAALVLVYAAGPGVRPGVGRADGAGRPRGRGPAGGSGPGCVHRGPESGGDPVPAR
jgi:tetratricopeptide (TPR) repeat protein